MLRLLTGNLLDAPTEALVNTVNTVGVMGKGIALMFKEAFPGNFAAYAAAVKQGNVQVGRMFVTERDSLDGPRFLINFPTKQHWRNPSQLQWVIDGLQDLRRVIEERQIRSIALPPLGCGNGGLDWAIVRPEIEKALGTLPDVDIWVYEPTEKYQNVTKRSGVLQLTPARVLIAEMVRRYSILGIECTYLEVQKIAWFLERSIQSLQVADPLDLRFAADKYGPYSDRLRHLLDALDGSYLHCNKRLSDAGPSDTIWFDQERRPYIDLYLKQESALPLRRVLDRAEEFIEGFQSPLGLELLATLDWLIVRENCPPTREGIRAGLAHWPAGPAAAQRKQKLFTDRLIDLGLGQLNRVQANANSPGARG
ncbi:MAG: macro domain-containing protein [Acidobacteriota bacterium]|jgi:O-acetyl-ADP-ribose deacetylase (regulator of RNase III)